MPFTCLGLDQIVNCLEINVQLISISSKHLGEFQQLILLFQDKVN